jgi:uncharacterized membrane protein
MEKNNKPSVCFTYRIELEVICFLSAAKEKDFWLTFSMFDILLLFCFSFLFQQTEKKKRKREYTMTEHMKRKKKSLINQKNLLLDMQLNRIIQL